jgi:hypothetical protein
MHVTFLSDFWKKFKTPVTSKDWKNTVLQTIYCPNCQSTHLKPIVQLISHCAYNHQYRCLNCDIEFNEHPNPSAPLEKPLPPLNIWMQCWYLMGCTESLSYIANILHLELALVEFMALQLQKTFNIVKPDIQMLDFEEWDKNTAQIRKQLIEDLIKQEELLNSNIATMPHNTNEFRRQQNLRRTLNANTEPPIPIINYSQQKHRTVTQSQAMKQHQTAKTKLAEYQMTLKSHATPTQEDQNQENQPNKGNKL